MSTDKKPRVERLLDLPGWFAHASIETAGTLWVPRFSVEIAGAMTDHLGAARRVDGALSLSGRALCLLQYQGMRRTRLIAWTLRDFMALWLRVPEALEQIAPWGADTPITLWLENTTASEHIIDARHVGHTVSQRNGRVLHARTAAPTGTNA